MWGNALVGKFYEKYYESTKILNEKYRDDNIGIIGKRQTGKSLLSILLVFHYGYSSSKKLKFCSLSREPFNHKLDDICYHIYGGNKWRRNHYDFFEIKNYKIKKPFLNFLRMFNMDVVVIDEFFYIKFTDMELQEMFYLCKKHGTKVIINGTPQFLIKSLENRYIKKLKYMGNLKIITDNFIINLPNYSRLIKIKKLKEQCQPKEKINL